MSSELILRGSHREHPANSVPVGKPASDDRIQITPLLRRRSPAPEPAADGRSLTHSELAEAHGASPEAARMCFITG